MPTCPKCGKKIDCLKVYSTEENKRIVTLVRAKKPEDDSLEWSTSEVVECTCTSDNYECPECDETLFKTDGNDCNPEEVLKFLRGQ